MSIWAKVSPFRKTIYFCLVSLIVFILRKNYYYDDPFITFRYARNFAEGIGLVYNPDEHVLSTTSPLFTLLLACIYPLWHNIPLAAKMIGAVSLSIGALVLVEISKQLGVSAYRYAALILYPSSPLLLSTLGSEIPLFLALGLISYYFCLKDRYNLAAGASALLVLTRPDGVIVPIILFTAYVIKYRKLPPLSSAFIFFSILLPWLIISSCYFGSPIPHTLAAKVYQGTMAVDIGFFHRLIEMIRRSLPLGINLIFLGLTFLGLAAVLAKKNTAIFFIAWPILHILGYSLLGVASYFWYYAVLVPGSLFLVGIGAEKADRLLHQLSYRLPKKFTAPSQTGSLLTLSILAVFCFYQIGTVWKPVREPEPRYWIYRKIGQWLKDNSPDNTQVGVLEAGIIGYYSMRPVIDFAGLIKPDIARQLSPNSTYEDSALYAIQQYSPEFVIMVQGQFPQVERLLIEKNCQRVEMFRGKNHGYSNRIDVYQCSLVSTSP